MSVGGVGGAGGAPDVPDSEWSIDPRRKPTEGDEAPAEMPTEPPSLLDTEYRSPGGVVLLPPAGMLYMGTYDTQGSSRVRNEGDAAIAGLRDAATRNTTG